MLFKNSDKIIDYINENPICYLVVTLGYTAVGLLEFLGLSSLVPAFSIILGEDVKGIPKFAVDFVREYGPSKIFILYILVVIAQMFISLFSEAYFIKYIGIWRTSFIIDYVKKVVGAKFEYSSVARPGEMEVVITRNVGLSVKNRYQLVVFLSDLVLAIFYLLTAIYTSVHVLIFFTILFSCYLLINRQLIKIKMDNFALAKEQYFQASTITSEYMRDIRTLLSSSVENFFFKIEEKARLAAQKQEVNDLINIYLKVSQTPILIVMIGIWLYFSKSFLDISNSKLIIILFIIYRAAPRIIAVLRGYADILESSVADVRVDEKFWNEHQNTGRELILPATTEPLFSLKNVTLSYKEKEILKNINFDIYSKQMVGLVGPSGSGKSTILDLFCSFIKPASGQFMVCGQLVDEDNFLKWARENISILRPESNLVSGSVYENVAFLTENIDEKRVDQLLESIQLDHLFIANKRIEKSGANLSAGQRQRILLARALYKNPKVLILDEPTSNLDAITEKIINDLILSLKGKVTLVIATHRNDLLGNCDIILNVGDSVVSCEKN